MAGKNKEESPEGGDESEQAGRSLDNLKDLKKAWEEEEEGSQETNNASSGKQKKRKRSENPEEAQARREGTAQVVPGEGEDSQQERNARGSNKNETMANSQQQAPEAGGNASKREAPLSEERVQNLANELKAARQVREANPEGGDAFFEISGKIAGLSKEDVERVQKVAGEWTAPEDRPGGSRYEASQRKPNRPGTGKPPEPEASARGTEPEPFTPEIVQLESDKARAKEERTEFETEFKRIAKEVGNETGLEVPDATIKAVINMLEDRMMKVFFDEGLKWVKANKEQFPQLKNVSESDIDAFTNKRVFELLRGNDEFRETLAQNERWQKDNELKKTMGRVEYGNGKNLPEHVKVILFKEIYDAEFEGKDEVLQSLWSAIHGESFDGVMSREIGSEEQYLESHREVAIRDERNRERQEVYDSRTSKVRDEWIAKEMTRGVARSEAERMFGRLHLSEKNRLAKANFNKRADELSVRLSPDELMILAQNGYDIDATSLSKNKPPRKFFGQRIQIGWKTERGIMLVKADGTEQFQNPEQLGQLLNQLKADTETRYSTKASVYLGEQWRQTKTSRVKEKLEKLEKTASTEVVSEIYGQMRQQLEHDFEKRFADNLMKRPDIAKIAERFKGEGRTVAEGLTRARELSKSLAGDFEEDEPAFFDWAQDMEIPIDKARFGRAKESLAKKYPSYMEKGKGIGILEFFVQMISDSMALPQARRSRTNVNAAA